MFFRSIKKYVEDNFASKREFENIKTITNDLVRKISILKNENDKLKRILRNSVNGKVTGFSVKPNYSENFSFVEYSPYKTYVYKSGEEYIFTGLYLEEPVFEQGNEENTVFVTSKGGTARYVLDLRSETFILIGKELQKPDSDSVEYDDNLIDISVKIDSQKLKDVLKNYQEGQRK